MSCAGCDDCPQDAWHLHVTVKPQREWSLKDVASALQTDIERYGVRPIVITNVFADGRPPYKELIPTLHFHGSEADASRKLFRIGVLLNNSGWRIRRLKIEGDARRVPAGRALYYETHVKESQLIGGLKFANNEGPISINAKGEKILTIRRHDCTLDQIMASASIITSAPVRIEAAVLDTNPDLDKEWINQ